MTEVKSVIQNKADDLRATRQQLDKLDVIRDLAKQSVEDAQIKLMEAQSAFNEVRILHTAIHLKLNAHINDMQELLETARPQ